MKTEITLAASGAYQVLIDGTHKGDYATRREAERGARYAKHKVALESIDEVCGTLADLGHWDECWAIRAALDAVEGLVGNPPGTSEDQMYQDVFKAARKHFK